MGVAGERGYDYRLFDWVKPRAGATLRSLSGVPV